MKTSVALLLPVAALLCGCSQPSPVGVWDVNVPVNGRQIPAVVDIKQDGSVVTTMTIPKQSMGVLEIPEIKVIADGTWKSDGKTFTQTTSSVKLDGEVPEMIKAGFQMAEKQIQDEMNKSRTAKLEYKDGTMVMSTTDGIIKTFVKHKS